VSMSNLTDRVEIITSVQRRRRWTASEKVRIVEETFELVARRHGVAPNQLFTWRRLVVEGALTAAGSGEQAVPTATSNRLRAIYPVCHSMWLETRPYREERALCEQKLLYSQGIAAVGFAGRATDPLRASYQRRLRRA
jgi:transposase-like protein